VVIISSADFHLKLAKLEEFQNLNQNRQGDSIGTISGKSGSWHVMLPIQK